MTPREILLALMFFFMFIISVFITSFLMQFRHRRSKPFIYATACLSCTITMGLVAFFIWCCDGELAKQIFVPTTIEGYEGQLFSTWDPDDDSSDLILLDETPFKDIEFPNQRNLSTASDEEITDQAGLNVDYAIKKRQTVLLEPEELDDIRKPYKELLAAADLTDEKRDQYEQEIADEIADREGDRRQGLIEQEELRLRYKRYFDEQEAISKALQQGTLDNENVILPLDTWFLADQGAVDVISAKPCMCPAEVLSTLSYSPYTADEKLEEKLGG